MIISSRMSLDEICNSGYIDGFVHAINILKTVLTKENTVSASTIGLTISIDTLEKVLKKDFSKER